jgi:hypothetical protein
MNVGMPQFNVPPIDPRTGQWNRVWFLFFQDIWLRTGGAQQDSGNDDLSIFDIDMTQGTAEADLPIEVDTLLNTEIDDGAISKLARSVNDLNIALQELPADADKPTKSDFIAHGIDIALILQDAQDAIAKATRALQDIIINNITDVDAIRSMAYQDAGNVKIKGGSIDGTTIGGTTKAAGAFTTISASGQITSTVATGTAPFSIASTTVVPSLNVSQLLGGTWAIPGAIGSTTPNTGRFTTVGVGTTTPTYRFVVSNGGAQGIECDSDGTAYGAGTTGILAFNRSTSAYIELNVTGLTVNLRASGTTKLTIDGTGIGFYGAATAAKPTVTGSRGGNAALASLLTGLASQGLITDSSTA